MWAQSGCRWCVPCLLSSCPLGAGGAGFRGFRCPAVCVPSLLSALSLCLRCNVLEICLYSHFRAVFSAVWGADVCLYRFSALRGLWGFYVREWLGGLEAYGAFASILSLSHPFFIFFAYLLGLCLCCPLLVLLPALFVLVSLWVFVFSFSLADYMQKRKGAKVLLLASSLRVLWVALSGCRFIFLVFVRA